MSYPGARVIAKLEKTHIEKQVQNKWGKPCFKVILVQTVKDLTLCEECKIANEVRRQAIYTMIEARSKNKDIFDYHQTKDVVVAVYPGWLMRFIKSLEEIGISDRIELKGAHLYRYFNHNIIITLGEVSKLQADIDFIGLCWLAHYETHVSPGLNLEIVVSLSGFCKFFCMMVGFEFFDCLLKFPTLVKVYTKPNTIFSIYDLKIVTDDYGIFTYPSLQTLTNFPKRFVEAYTFWKKVPFYSIPINVDKAIEDPTNTSKK